FVDNTPLLLFFYCLTSILNRGRTLLSASALSDLFSFRTLLFPTYSLSERCSIRPLLFPTAIHRGVTPSRDMGEYHEHDGLVMLVDDSNMHLWNFLMRLLWREVKDKPQWVKDLNLQVSVGGVERFQEIWLHLRLWKSKFPGKVPSCLLPFGSWKTNVL
ncbi:hypothetical protein LINPERPRIM_LOCUS25887, partial [Linum perenne]